MRWAHRDKLNCNNLYSKFKPKLYMKIYMLREPSHLITSGECSRMKKKSVVIRDIWIKYEATDFFHTSYVARPLIVKVWTNFTEWQRISSASPVQTINPLGLVWCSDLQTILACIIRSYVVDSFVNDYTVSCLWFLSIFKRKKIKFTKPAVGEAAFDCCQIRKVFLFLTAFSQTVHFPVN